MRVLVIGFAVGDWLLQQQAGLLAAPASWLAFALGVAGGLAAKFLADRRALRGAALLLAGGLAGFGYAGLRADARLADELAGQLEGRDVAVTGVVASLPQKFERGVRFEFEVETAAAALPRRVSLAWYRGWHEDEWHGLTEVHAGERWHLTVRLKRPHGNLNPHGFDYEAWLLAQDIRATGYVRNAPDNARLADFVWSAGNMVEHLRETIRARFNAALPDEPYAGVLVALAIGDQRSIDNGLWRVFNRTGITHLVSISGLHVTMVAALLGGLVGGVWRRVPALALRLPARQAAVAAGFIAALGYTALAGWGVPAQRTLYILGCAALALWLRRDIAARRVLALALLVVLAIDPWAVLSAGFWLSFGAVALLFLAGWCAQAAEFRPPAVPLVTHDPYFSIWSAADRLTDAPTTHWTGKPHRLNSLLRVDGQSFRLLGDEPANCPALPQIGLEVLPTRTICRFANDQIKLTLTFTSPLLPAELYVLAQVGRLAPGDLVWNPRLPRGVAAGQIPGLFPALVVPEARKVPETRAAAEV
ncbi:MAG: DUF4131 domain-containing protein, partial [Zoogloea sp.]|nr:DUF4131 domain-containing protein [Zoogloea sp.]